MRLHYCKLNEPKNWQHYTFDQKIESSSSLYLFHDSLTNHKFCIHKEKARKLYMVKYVKFQEYVHINQAPPKPCLKCGNNSITNMLFKDRLTRLKL